jgi:DNA-binding transcriptional ArsR family regulator
MNAAMDEQDARQAAELFRALGDPRRIQILALLLEGERNVGSIAEALGVSASSVSHHLRSLRQLRMVSVRREGRNVFYRCDGEPLEAILKPVLDWIHQD